MSRGRKPDGWYGTGVSLKIPIYHELNCDEFTEVMAMLTKTEDEQDRMMHARQIFHR